MKSVHETDGFLLVINFASKLKPFSFQTNNTKIGLSATGHMAMGLNRNTTMARSSRYGLDAVGLTLSRFKI